MQSNSIELQDDIRIASFIHRCSRTKIGISEQFQHAVPFLEYKQVTTTVSKLKTISCNYQGIIIFVGDN